MNSDLTDLHEFFITGVSPAKDKFIHFINTTQNRFNRERLELCSLVTFIIGSCHQYEPNSFTSHCNVFQQKWVSGMALRGVARASLEQ